jgi:hypothetical protein
MLNCTCPLYPPLVRSARTTFREVTRAPALLWTNTPFLSRVSTLGLKPMGGYSRQNGVSVPRAFKQGRYTLYVFPWWNLWWKIARAHALA